MAVRKWVLVVGSFAVLATVFAGAIARGQSAEEQRQMSGEGDWEKRMSAPGLAPGSCRQVWICLPTGLVSVQSGESLSLPPDALTSGSCRTIGEDSCRACDAPAPAQDCRWEIRPDTQ